jgi:hypothetical protein
VLRLPSGARVRLFYPARRRDDSAAPPPTAGSSSSSSSFAPYCTNRRRTSDGIASSVGLRQLGLSFLLGHLADVLSGCVEDAPITIDRPLSAGERRPLPLLVYSHGVRREHGRGRAPLPRDGRSWGRLWPRWSTPKAPHLLDCARKRIGNAGSTSTS